MHLLIASESPDTRALAAFHLVRAGYRVSTACTGAEAVRCMAEQQPRLALLSVTLPDVQTLDIVRRACARPARPRTAVVVLMGAVDGHESRLDALTAGADDVIGYPLDERELLLRVERVIGRLNAAHVPTGEEFEAGPIHIDIAAHLVTVSGTTVQLTPTEFRILRALIENPGRLRTRAQLTDSAGSASVHARARVLDMHISRLRQKLGDAATLIETVPGHGYRLRQPNTRPTDPTALPDRCTTL